MNKPAIWGCCDLIVLCLCVGLVVFALNDAYEAESCFQKTGSYGCKALCDYGVEKAIWAFMIAVAYAGFIKDRVKK